MIFTTTQMTLSIYEMDKSHVPQWTVVDSAEISLRTVVFSCWNMKAGEKWWVLVIIAPQLAFYMGLKLWAAFSPFKGPPTVQKSLDCGLTTVIFFLATPSSLQDISSLTRD